MSLTALAIRTCAVLALYDRTPVGRRVYDSELAPIGKLATEEVRSFLTVAIDEASRETETIGLFGGDESLLLVIEARAASRAQVSGASGDEAIVLPDTTMGLETSLDFLTRSIVTRLSDDFPFALLFWRFVLKVNKSWRVRGGAVDTGERFAARQHVFDLEPIAEPPPGEAPEVGSPWADLIAALRALNIDPAIGGDPDLAAYVPLADAIEAAMTMPVGTPTWRVEATRLGVSPETASDLGIGPLASVGIVAPIAAVTLGGDLEAITIDATTDDVSGDL